VSLKLAASALLLFAGTASAQKIARDWAKYPAIVQIDTREDVFAVGDAHGVDSNPRGPAAASRGGRADA